MKDTRANRHTTYRRLNDLSIQHIFYVLAAFFLVFNQYWIFFSCFIIFLIPELYIAYNAYKYKIDYKIMSISNFIPTAFLIIPQIDSVAYSIVYQMATVTFIVLYPFLLFSYFKRFLYFNKYIRVLKKNYTFFENFSYKGAFLRFYCDTHRFFLFFEGCYTIKFNTLSYIVIYKNDLRIPNTYINDYLRDNFKNTIFDLEKKDFEIITMLGY